MLQSYINPCHSQEIERGNFYFVLLSFFSQSVALVWLKMYGGEGGSLDMETICQNMAFLDMPVKKLEAP